MSTAETVTTPEVTSAPEAPVKRGRGRPKGSKNKPKNVPAPTSTDSTETK